ncbi:MAG: class I SAM-dependent methyltransferase [Promethearchaeota archaeon]
MLTEEKYWDQLAPTWDKKITSKRNPHYHYYHTIDLLVIQLLQETKAKKALEIGCGTAGCAINVLKTLKRDNIHITGIDISKKMIKFGREKIKKANLEDKISLEVGNATDLPFQDKEFDMVFSRGGVLSYTTEPSKLLQQIKRVLCIGGVIGLDVIPKPPKGKDYYIGKISDSPSNKEVFQVESTSLMYEEFYTDGFVQVARKYHVKSDANLYNELQTLFQKLPSSLPGILQPPIHLKEAQLISDRSVTLYSINKIQEKMTEVGFQITDVYGTGYANLMSKNSEIFEFVTANRDKFSRIEIILHKVLCLDSASMLFITGKKCEKC